MEDKRFAHVLSDPKFRRIPKGERKVKIDKRFQSMFKDKKFKVKYTVDKRGRPVNQSSTEDLKRYYELSSGDSSSSEEVETEKPGKFVKSPPSTNKDTPQALDETDKELSSDVKEKLKNLRVDYARGESKLLSDSSSSDDDEESEDEVSESEDIDHKWGELDNDADRTEEVTRRLAACNMDWDRIRATDLMVLFNSFLPASGAVEKVAIYPSEFGKKRMLEEEVKGPMELVDNKREDGEQGDDTEKEEGSKYHMEKLRQYQLNRLKYYYAVITFDSANSANKIYTECDGMEYESSATKVDLRFVPDDMTFDDPPKEVCDKLPELDKYQPRFFTNSALQQAKVDLTWDETAPDRLEITQKLSAGKTDDITPQDLKNYLAGSSDEEESEAETSEVVEDNAGVGSIDKYKLLLQEVEEKDKKSKNRDVEMEISWGIDLKDKTERLVKKKMDESEDKTPFQKYLDKRKEKRKEKKKVKKGSDEESDVPSDIDLNDPYFAEEFNNSDFKKPGNKKTRRTPNSGSVEDDQGLKLLLDEDTDKGHFSLKKIQDRENEATGKKKKHKLKKRNEETVEDNFKLNVDDERFSALFTSHLYNIDPTDSHFKKTKGMETLISEKIKRRVDDEAVSAPKKSKGRDAELSVLVKSVKRKTEALSNSSRKKK